MVYSPWGCKESDRTNSFTFHLLRVPGFGRGRWALAPGSKGEIQLSTTFWTCEDSHLVTQPKPLKRPGWWKGKFALFWMPARGGGAVPDTCPKTDSSIPDNWEKRFYRLR